MGLEFVTKRFPYVAQQIIKICVGALTFSFFGYIAYLGYTFAEKGANQLSTVFSMPMAYAYAAIPVTFALSSFQAFLVWLEDIYALKLYLASEKFDVQGEQL